MFFSSWFRKLLIFLVLGAAIIQPCLVYAEVDIFQSTASPTQFTTSSDSIFFDVVSTTSKVISNRELIPEPIIRVGLYKSNVTVQFKSDFAYEVWSGSKSWGVIPSGQTVQLSYNKGLYVVKSSDLEFESKTYIRLVPKDPDGFFNIVNYSRLVSGRGKLSFNT